jgi:uncharacterized protein YecE (DUF72 family)
MQQTLFQDNHPTLIPPKLLWKLQQRNIYLGTSGYSYEDWRGKFYPRATPKNRMLEYYQQFFPAVELNFSYYAMPQVSTLYQIRNKAPQTQFSIKAHGSITHQRKRVLLDWQQFGDAVLVLAEADQLAAVLFQFPFSFHKNTRNQEYLHEVIEYFSELPLVIEFRHGSWVNPETVEYCRQMNVTMCSVDAPKLPGLTGNAVVAGKQIAYYRLHGRNAFQWFEGDNSTRYDYTYSKQELQGIVNNILSLLHQADSAYVFANNHPRAQAIETTITLAHMLEEALKVETVRQAPRLAHAAHSYACAS